MRDTFDDWEVRCAPEGEECILYQLAMDDEDYPVAEFSLVKLPEGNEAVAGVTVVTPLMTFLPAGLGIQIDGGEAQRVPFNFCNPVGCFAQIPLDQASVAAFQRGRVISLSLASAANPAEPVELDVSLIGFTAAYNSINPTEQ